MPTPFRITLGDGEYPCTSWELAEHGKKLERVWADGFWDGIGESRVRNPRRCFIAHGFDLTSPPYLRLPPVPVTISGSPLTFANSGLFGPVFYIEALSTDATPVGLIYFFHGRNRVKIRKDTNTVVYNDDNASAFYGKPVLFEGSIYVPRGASINAVKLVPGTAAANAATENAALVDVGVPALHFATITDEGVGKLARAFSTNNIDLSPDGVTFGGDFEVGDSSFAINTIVESQGELMPIKSDGPYRFDPAGNSLPIQKFTQPTLGSNIFEGAGSHGHGSFAFWTAKAALWRIFGDLISPIGFESDPQFFNFSDSDIPVSSWHTASAFGKWLYASRSGQTYQGFIEDDGRPKWYGAIANQVATTAHRVIVGNDPSLWVLTYTSPTTWNIYRYTLQADGSFRAALGAVRGVFPGTLPKFRLGTDDYDRPDRSKQFRRFWVVTEGHAAADADVLQLKISRDGAADQQIGANVTASGLTERVATTGTNDLFREVRAGFDFSAVSGTSDVRIRAFGTEVRTPTVYKAVIPLTPETVRGYSGGIDGSLERLRDLQNAQYVACKAPGVDQDFQGHVLSVAEKAEGFEGGEGIGYTVDVMVERFDVP